MKYVTYIILAYFLKYSLPEEVKFSKEDMHDEKPKIVINLYTIIVFRQTSELSKPPFSHIFVYLQTWNSTLSLHDILKRRLVKTLEFNHQERFTIIGKLPNDLRHIPTLYSKIDRCSLILFINIINPNEGAATKAGKILKYIYILSGIFLGRW